MMFPLVAVALALTAADAPPVAERLYDGATIAAWQERMRHVRPTALGSEALVPGLAALVRDRDVPGVVRKEAALTLARIGPKAVDAALPELLRALDEPDRPDDSPRAWAAKALAILGPQAARAAPRLIALVRDARQPLDQRQYLVESLAKIGTAHPDVLPLFVELLTAAQDEGASQVALAETAADTASLLGGQGEPLAPLLIRILRDRGASNLLRRNAAIALGEISARADVVSGPLAEVVVFDPSETVRDGAAGALGRLGVGALPVLRQLLARPDEATRRRALGALAQLGPAARPLRNELLAALEDPSEANRLAASDAVIAVTADIAPALPKLAALVASDDRAIRVAAARRLEQLGAKSAAARPALEKLLDDPRGDVRRLAAKVLEAMAM